MKKEQKLNKNQKGFSLVELIIVIAIMAVLVGVLAPAFLRYVEKSRKSADVSAIDSIMSAMEAVAIDPTINMPKDGIVQAEFTATGAITFHSTSLAAKTAMDEICGEPKLKSTTWKGVSGILQGTVGANGTIKFELSESLASSSDDVEGMLIYSPGLADKIDPVTSITKVTTPTS